MIRKLFAALALLVAVPALSAPIGISAPTATKTNVTTTDPTASNDGTQGYVVGSVWTNTTTGTRSFAVDVTTGAAVWVQQGNLGFPAYVSGRTYTPQASVISTGAVAATDTCYAVPIVIYQRVTINALAIRISTGATGSVRLGLYANATGVPAAKLTEGGSAGNTATGTTISVALSSNYTITPGIYFLVSLFNALPSVSTTGSADHALQALLGGVGSAAFGTAPSNGFTATCTYTSGLPSTFGTATAASAAIPLPGIVVN